MQCEALQKISTIDLTSSNFSSQRNTEQINSQIEWGETLRDPWLIKTLTQGGRVGSVMKRVCCSCRGPRFCSQRPHSNSNRLELQSQGVHQPLPTSAGTRQTYAVLSLFVFILMAMKINDMASSLTPLPHGSQMVKTSQSLLISSY